MGKIYDRFNNLTFLNEDEVKQNFVIPLLSEFLGYSLNEILPEQKFPARDVHSGVYLKGDTKGLTNKPDYIICLNGEIENPKIILDAKDQKEDIDKHLPQIKSYTLSVGINLIVITNGVQIKVLNSNDLIFKSNNIGELDERFEQLYLILGRQNQAIKTLKEIITGIDEKIALGLNDKDALDKDILRKRIELSDFSKYLSSVKKHYEHWQIPSDFQGLNNIKIEAFNPTGLHYFHLFIDDNEIDEKKEFTYFQLIREFKSNIKIFIGETGIGKTTLLKYLTYQNAISCIELKQVQIPVYIALRNIGQHHSLEELIKNELQTHFYNIDSVYDFISKNNILLVLDGYDEVIDHEVYELDETIKKLSTKCSCLICTRESRIPIIKPADVFRISSLKEEKIELIAKEHFGKDYNTFLNEIENKGLKKEAQNTLLLLLMISIFKSENELPQSLTRITHKVVQRIEQWEHEKGKKDLNPIDWKIKEEILSILAYNIIKKNNPILDILELETIVLPFLIEAEERKLIPAGLTQKQIINKISATGLIIFDQDKLFFWHRIFLNYFSSIALAKAFIKNNKIIHDISNQAKWESTLIGTSFILEDSTEFIKLLKNDLWLSSYCLFESKKVSNELTKTILKELLERCSSKILEIRSRALFYLKKTDKSIITDEFWKLFNSSEYLDVKMIAIEEIAKEKTKKAKEFVIKNIDWDEPASIMGRGSQTSIAHALSNFDDPEILMILNIWSKKNDLWTSMECRDIFIKLIKQDRVSKEIRKELINFYFTIYDLDRKGADKIRDIAKILITLNDETLIPRLISSLNNSDNDFTYNYSNSIDILSSYTSPYSTEIVYKNAINQSNSNLIQERCAEILASTKAYVPFEYVHDLEKSTNKGVQLYGIKLLAKFPFDVAKDKILGYLNSDNQHFQNAAFEVVDKNASILEIIATNNLPKHFFWPSLYTFLKSVRKYKITEASPKLDYFTETIKNRNDFRLLCEIANTYVAIGEFQKAVKIVESFYNDKGELLINDDYDLNILEELVVNFEKEFATKILLNIYDKIKHKMSKSGHFMESKYLDAVDKVGTLALKETTKRILEDEIEKHLKDPTYYLHLERIFRTLTQIGSIEDEDWLLEILSKNAKINWTDLKRGIECLGIFGTTKSLNVIKQVAKDNSKNDYTLNTCLYAYESIIRRSGIQREIKQEELLN